MKLPEGVVIPREKLTHYLLVPQEQNDKSKFLAQIGFTQDNVEMLEKAIRQLIKASEAIKDRDDDYGTFYRVTGMLVGVTGELRVVTIWLYSIKEGNYRFITLKPDKESST